MIHQTIAEVIDNTRLTDSIYLVTFRSKELTQEAKPGQFVNIRISEGCYPYLRRPFSYCDVVGDEFKVLFSIYGIGTKVISQSSIGAKFDIIGPLGNGFNIDSEFNTAILVAGGLGVAPFAFLKRALPKNVKVVSYIGARTKELIATYGLDNVVIATDDGSLGEKGTVIDLLKEDLMNGKFEGKFKIFGCGPTPMLKALKVLCEEFNLNCEVSTESAMACGFGICQGCPIELADSSGYRLICKDGPVFNIEEIKL